MILKNFDVKIYDDETIKHSQWWLSTRDDGLYLEIAPTDGKFELSKKIPDDSTDESVALGYGLKL